MSWLNLNDSLNNLKGQISNFASNVLADEETVSTSNNEVDNLKELCANQQEEIGQLKKIIDQLNVKDKALQVKDNNDQSNKWVWESPDTEVINLKQKILQLENEKRELEKNLELLDLEYQQNTEKIVGIKDELQNDYNELEEKFILLQDNNNSLIANDNKTKLELDNVKLKYEQLLNENNSIQVCQKCKQLSEETVFAELEKLRNEIVVLNSNNATLNKTLEDNKNVNNEEIRLLSDKLKLSESENQILIAELQKCTNKIKEYQLKIDIDEENYRKLATILDGYEEQVSCLKKELSLKTDDNNEFIKLKEDYNKILQEKEVIHKKYTNILTDNVKKFIDCDQTLDFNECTLENNPQIIEFNNQVNSLLRILLDFKIKCEHLEKEIFVITEEKTKMLTEKNHEIEKLLQNSEVLSQEVITKSQVIKDYEKECNDLIKNNDILLNELKGYKNNSGLQTISESNEDNLLLLESQLESANNRIKELEKDINHSNNIQKLKEEIKLIKTDKEILIEEKEELNGIMEKMKSDLENTEYQYSEINVNMDILKDEIMNQSKKVEELMKQNQHLEKLKVQFERNNEDIREELNDIKEKLLFEEDIRRQFESEVRTLNEKLQNAKIIETKLKLQNDTLNRELSNLSEAKIILETNLNKTLQDLKEYENGFVELQNENGNLKGEIVKNQEIINELKMNQEKLEELSVKESANKLQAMSLEDKDNIDSAITDSRNLIDKLTIDEAKMETETTNESVELLQKENSDLKEQLNIIVQERNRFQEEYSKIIEINNRNLVLLEKIAILEKTIDELNSSKNELTNVIITKHQENVTYHNEIQRLSQIINAEMEKSRNFEYQIEQLRNMNVSNEEMKKKEKEELEKLKDQNNFLKEKCDILTQNLLQEQNKYQKYLEEQPNQSEKELQLSKKLERLQNHLIEVEEHYTQELLRVEEKNQELQVKMNEIEQREKNSSTIYTSVSIRANQHVETLQHQLQLITNQRDELRKRISDAEDNANKQLAALANLQFVLEKVQKEKEKAIQTETTRIRKQINVEKQIQDELRGVIGNLQSQLDESKQGLQAASRLSDQLEFSKQTITSLREEVARLTEKLKKSEEKVKNISSQTDGKVDKSLIKNLVIGFVSSNNNSNLSKDQMQILKIIATVLDFNQQDHDKVNLGNKSQGSWLGSLLSPQSSQNMSQESLSQAFVKFLENESKPRNVPSLLNSDDIKSEKSEVEMCRKKSSVVLSEIVLPTFADFAQSRNSSSILKDVLKDNS